MWYSSLPCFRCGLEVGENGLPYLLTEHDEDAVMFCPDCAIRLFDIVQTWYSTTQVGA